MKHKISQKWMISKKQHETTLSTYVTRLKFKAKQI
jgi:hypothetical protein